LKKVGLGRNIKFMINWVYLCEQIVQGKDLFLGMWTLRIRKNKHDGIS